MPPAGNWLPFEQARLIVVSQKFENQTEFYAWKQRPPNIPSNPRSTYKEEWSGWAYWLGTGPASEESRPKKSVPLLPFEKAHELAQELMRKYGVTCGKEWNEWVKTSARPPELPADPYKAYRFNGWKGWPYWFGHKPTGYSIYEPVRSFLEAREFARRLGFKESRDWVAWAHTPARPDDIPLSPDFRYQDEGWIGWADFLGYQGRLTHNGITKFLRSLRGCIEHLTELDLYLILVQNGMLKRDQRLLGAKLLRGLMHARTTADIELAEKEFIVESSDESGGDERSPDQEELDRLETVPAEFSHENNFDIVDGLKTVDRILELEITEDNEDNDAIAFMIDERIEMLWREAMVVGEEILFKRLAQIPSGKYAQLIHARFQQEYNSVKALPVPKGYRIVDANGQRATLNVMQRLTAYRLSEQKRIGNWSGVGTGKTNAAVFSAAVLDAKMTLVLATKSTLAGWRKTISLAFDAKSIHVHDGHPMRFQFRAGRRNFVVVNYEKFQLAWTEAFIQLLCQQSTIDFIVFDEVQFVRQRHTAEWRISERRWQVNQLIRSAFDKNPEVHILAMSATPIVNNLVEAVKLLELIRPDKDFSKLPTGSSIANAIGVHLRLKRHGIRFMPRYDLQLEKHAVEIDGQDLREELSQVQPRNILQMEQTLLKSKLRHLRSWVRRGTLIYTHYVGKGEIIESLTEAIEQMGLRAMLFTGIERVAVEDFVASFRAGTVDVLIGSGPVGTGVDGLQFVLDRIVFISLPWSHAEYEQIVGRLWRQGSAFEKVDVYIPQVALNDGPANRWSWDERRLRCIEYKQTLADAAMDGIIPKGGLPSPEEMQRQSLEALQKWIERSNSKKPSTADSQSPTRGVESLINPRNCANETMKYPLRHLSVRVPWHDGGWTGTVCQRPATNTSCLRLGRIAERKRDQEEEAVGGRSILELITNGIRLPPCIDERAAFMATFPFVCPKPNRYAMFYPKTHGHLVPINCHYPAYSVGATPIRWFTRNLVFGNSERGISGLVDRYPLSEVSELRERDLWFGKQYIQDLRNQTALLEGFWKHIRPKESLLFFYAMPIPLIEESHRRTLVGVGRVQELGPLMEFEHRAGAKDALRAMLWERVVTHSIRPQITDGFLLPYYDALERSDEGLEFDPAEAVAYVPDDHLMEFTYGAEHVTNDGAISGLRSIRDALLRCSNLFGYEAANHFQWIDAELGRLWQRRGPWPGIGAVLCATGVPLGNFMAEYLLEKTGTNQNPWRVWDHLIANGSRLIPGPLTGSFKPKILAFWMNMSPINRAFLELLSRMSLTLDQVGMLATAEGRRQSKITLTEDEMVANPYLIYETTRLIKGGASIGVVDRGLFPVVAIREKHPIPEPSQIKSAVDVRRLHALTVHHLEHAAANGHTLQSRADIVQSIQNSDRENSHESTRAIAGALKDAQDKVFSGEIGVVTMADDSVGYQLKRLALAGELIRQAVEERIRGERFTYTIDWRKSLDESFKGKEIDASEQEREEQGRVEKTAALSELASSRFSVLMGRAGTGKTTVLSVLCSQNEINRDKVLLLAPTGKARVVMEKEIRRTGVKNIRSMTLAGFLKLSGRYDLNSQRYKLGGQRGDEVVGTVIVDECSMLTEEMLAAILESFQKVDRLILVGDYRQLPPIGPGRPFFDIVRRLEPEFFEPDRPRVKAGFAELVVTRRQAEGNRDDLMFASWFAGDGAITDDDRIFQILSGHQKSNTLRFETWETPDDLKKILPQILKQELEFDPKLEEWQAFCKSLGGEQNQQGSFWFHVTQESQDVAESAANHWQILSPVRAHPWGVEALNHFIHERFKAHQLERARKSEGNRSIPSPKGADQIVYGDKVIYSQNNRWMPIDRVDPPQREKSFLARGEIGIVVGPRRARQGERIPKTVEVEFSTQLGRKISFKESELSDEREPSLVLAYALTVHQSQGSEFGTVILVLPRSPLMVTREMLYTALTRQKKKVVVLLQGTENDLHGLRSGQNSETERRITNLFRKPIPIERVSRSERKKRIHRTTRGEMVFSKSEVIVANLLHSHGIEYAYEKQLRIEGVPRGVFPDFTIEDSAAGVTYYWEHLGMLSDDDYSRKWKLKERWYTDNRILPWDAPEKTNRRLITTRDGNRKDIDSAAIQRLIEQVFG